MTALLQHRVVDPRLTEFPWVSLHHALHPQKHEYAFSLLRWHRRHRQYWTHQQHRSSRCHRRDRYVSGLIKLSLQLLKRSAACVLDAETLLYSSRWHLLQVAQEVLEPPAILEAQACANCPVLSYLLACFTLTDALLYDD